MIDRPYVHDPRKTLTKWELFSLLAESDAPARHVTDSNGNVIFGLLLGVSREDDSGSSFNVTVANQSGNTTFHVRTID